MRSHSYRRLRAAAGSLLLATTVSAQLTEQWLDPEFPPQRFEFAFANDPVRDRVVIFSGRSLVADTWEWDGLSWTQRTLPSAPPGRQSARMVWDSARQVLVMFGGNQSSGVRLDETWEYDGRTWTQRMLGQSPPARTLHMMAYDAARRQVVLFGGLDAAGNKLGDTWLYNGANWRNAAAPINPPAEFDSAMEYDAARRQIVLTLIGQQTWTWNGFFWNNVTSAVHPPSGQGKQMTYDAVRQRIVLVTTDVGRQPEPQTWEWDGSGWTRMTPAQSPPLVQGFRLAFSPRSGTVVLHGTLLAPETWEWDGVDWTEKDYPLGLPSRMSSPSMAYDSGRDRLVVYYNWGTWEYDGTGWEFFRQVPSLPMPTGDQRMVYDSARGVMVLYGGYSGSPSAFETKTYEWDGSSWTQRFVGAPTEGTNTAMAYDAARQQVVLFGGSTSSNVTWVYDGTSWTGLQPAAAPSPRLDPRMAYDPVREKVVLFGGGDLFGNSKFDTWEWNGAVWTERFPSQSPTSLSAVTWDSTRQRIIGVEGHADGGRLWAWDGDDWIRFGATRPGLTSFWTTLAYHEQDRELWMYQTGTFERRELFVYKNTVAACTSPFGGACGAPELRAFGKPKLGNPSFGLDLFAAPAAAPVVYLVGARSADIPIGPCTLRVDPDASVAIPAPAGPTGFASLAVPVPDISELLGVPAFAQTLVIDAGAPLGFTLTAGLEMVFGE